VVGRFSGLDGGMAQVGHQLADVDLECLALALLLLELTAEVVSRRLGLRQSFPQIPLTRLCTVPLVLAVVRKLADLALRRFRSLTGDRQLLPQARNVRFGTLSPRAFLGQLRLSLYEGLRDRVDLGRQQCKLARKISLVHVHRSASPPVLSSLPAKTVQTNLGRFRQARGKPWEEVLPALLSANGLCLFLLGVTKRPVPNVDASTVLDVDNANLDLARWCGRFLFPCPGEGETRFGLIREHPTTHRLVERCEANHIVTARLRCRV
jgi:hypothetical protein